jgi:hypothetical protein
MSPFFDGLETQLHQAAKREIVARRPLRFSRAWWRRPRVLALLAVGAAVLATPAIAKVTGVWAPSASPLPHPQTATTGSGCTQPETPPAAPAPLTTAPVSRQLTSILGVLRRPYASQDRIQGHGLPTTLISVAGINPSAIRFVGSAAGHRFFIVPNLGARPRPALPARCLERMTPAQRRAYTDRPHSTGQPQICLASATASGCGATASDLLSRGTELSLAIGNNETSVVGVVPDGVAAITLAYGSSQRTFSVHNNFFSYTIAVKPGQNPTSTVWDLSNGSTRQIP